MKKNLLAIVAIVLGLGFSAFTTHKVPVTKTSNDPVFHWFNSTTGLYTGRTSDKTSEITPSGCLNTNSIHCEDGYLDQDLKVSGVPASGLNDNPVIRDVIFKP